MFIIKILEEIFFKIRFHYLDTSTKFGIFEESGKKIMPMKTRIKEIDNHTVSALDISRYMGTWYEIARYEHYFEKGMTHVTATYATKPNGKITVLNEGLKKGKHKQVIGKAYQPQASEPGKLKVSFFLWFYSDYYIMELDDDYQYAVIGSSSDKYLWILSRTKTLPASLYAELLKRIQKRGYDTEKLVTVQQE